MSTGLDSVCSQTTSNSLGLFSTEQWFRNKSNRSFPLRIKLRILKCILGLWGVALASSVQGASCVVFPTSPAPELCHLLFAVTEISSVSPFLPLPHLARPFSLSRQLACHFTGDLCRSSRSVPGILSDYNHLLGSRGRIYCVSSTVLSTFCTFLNLIINLVK